MSRGPNLIVRVLGDGSLDPHSCEMDPAVWSQLPWEMVLKMLTMLPRLSQLRFRAVCKEWCCLLSLPGLLRQDCSGALLCAYRVQPGGSNLPMPRNTVSAINLWRSIPNYGDSYFRQALSHSRLDVDKHSVAAQDGVLCVQVRTDIDAYWDNPRRREVRDVFFVNPMTSTWRRVEKSGWPDLLGCNMWDKVDVGRAKADVAPALGGGDDPVATASSLRLLYGCSLRDSTYQGWITCVYTGESQAWDNTERTLHPLRLADDRGWFDPTKEGSVICAGTLYAYDAKDHRLFVHRFDTGAHEWHTLPPAPGVNHISRFYLLERTGTVFFLGLCCQAHDLSFHIWRLEQFHAAQGGPCICCQWQPVAVMPGSVLSRVASSFQGERWSMDAFEACAAGRVLFTIFRASSRVQFVGYDLHRLAWQFGFQGEDPVELATYDGFFEARMDLHLYNGGGGSESKHRPKAFGYESGAGFVFECGLRPSQA